MQKQEVFSDDGVEFRFTTERDLLAHFVGQVEYTLAIHPHKYESLTDGMNGRPFWVGKSELLTHEGLVELYHVDRLIDMIDEHVADQVGPDMKTDVQADGHEARAELRDLIVDWAKRHVTVSHRDNRITDVEERQVEGFDEIQWKTGGWTRTSYGYTRSDWAD